MATKKQEKAAPVVYVATKPFELTVTKPSGLKVTEAYKPGDVVELPDNYKPDPIAQQRLSRTNAGLALAVEYVITYMDQSRKQVTELTSRTAILPVAAQAQAEDA